MRNITYELDSGLAISSRGPVQKENAGALFKMFKNFETATAEC